MKGVPIRMEIGPKDLEKNSLVIVKRNSREKKNISINENPVDQIVKELDAMQDELFEIAKSKHDNMISGSTDYKELCERLGVSVDHKHYICANALEYDYSFGEPVGLEKFMI